MAIKGSSFNRTHVFLWRISAHPFDQPAPDQQDFYQFHGMMNVTMDGHNRITREHPFCHFRSVFVDDLFLSFPIFQTQWDVIHSFILWFIWTLARWWPIRFHILLSLGTMNPFTDDWLKRNPWAWIPF